MLPLDALWFAVLILLLAIFCVARLMSVHVFWALILLVLVLGLALTVTSLLRRKRRDGARLTVDEAILLEYLKSHGITGNLSELAQGLRITEDEALKLLALMEGRGTIPAGSIRIFQPAKTDSRIS